MKKLLGKRIILWAGVFSLLLILSACSSSNRNVSDAKVENSQETVQSDERKEGSATTVQYTTITGEQVEIPANPKRVVYLGDSLGDFLAMDIPVIGNNLVHASGKVYDGKTSEIVDVGNPGDLELMLSLEPDLIINTYHQDADRNEALSKIAPTVPFNSALPYKERVTEIGKIFGKQEEAAGWIAKFEVQLQEMWDKLQLAEGETATVFLQLGKTLYVMGNRSLGAIIYDEQGFAIPSAVKEHIIDEGQTFVTVSEEVLPEYAGDHLFILVQDNDESKTETDRLLQSPLWGTLPAVQKGNVYITSANWNTDVLLALEQLLEELPQWMQRQ
ncbi:ABC transporter substrate-binding protein [Lysinibacillus sp. ZYM-1]|uniref:ABC transporter substrate-binding protein n=1 Tax=Lysinibacillus sp. ZYM-1 TaxID=1681184 RepID=UPI0006CE6C23|nr:ABC transporter substrate-binding protein [Lysinibacillus sp. ZYM-1]KPN94279.1 ABC transporter [Lysinibacillus sp. ZYM-1]